MRKLTSACSSAVVTRERRLAISQYRAETSIEQKRGRRRRAELTLGRSQFSDEKAKTVRTLIPHLQESFTISFKTLTPSWCPADAGSALPLAHLPFPSMITATCLGIRSGLSPSGTSSPSTDAFASSSTTTWTEEASAAEASGTGFGTAIARFLNLRTTDGTDKKSLDLNFWRREEGEELRRRLLLQRAERHDDSDDLCLGRAGMETAKVDSWSEEEEEVVSISLFIVII